MLDTPVLLLRRKCLDTLRMICGQRALLPRSVKITPDYNRFDDPQYRGGYADVWKGEYQGRKVAVKVLRMYVSSDLDKITSVCFRLGSSESSADQVFAEIQQRSYNVEKPQKSKCAPVVRSNNGRQAPHNDITMDGQREYQRVC